MHSTPVSMARPKLVNSSPIISASPMVIWRTPGGRFGDGGQRGHGLRHVAQRLARELDLEVHVAGAVVSGPPRRGRR